MTIDEQLKAEKTIILEELKAEIELSASLETDSCFADGEKFCANLIQQKIDSLKGEK